MADDNGTSNGDGQTGAGGTGDQGSQGGQGSGTPQQQASGTPSDSRSAERLEAELAKVRKEAAEARTKLKALEDEKLSESEKLQNRVKELEEKEKQWERERTESRLRSQVAEAGRKAGAIDPDVLYRLVDPDDIVLDDSGKPKNLDALIKHLRDTRPYLFGKPGSADGGAGRRTGATGAETMNDRIRRLAGR